MDNQIVEFERPDQGAMMITADAFADRMSAMNIDNNDDYEDCGLLLKRVKVTSNELDLKRKSITRPLDEAKKNTMALFKPVLDALASIEKSAKRKMIDYQTEQERKARELQAKQEAAARKEREKLEERALKHESKGREERAARLREEAELNNAAPVPPSMPVAKAAGVSTREIWKVEVVDKMALIKAVAAGQAPMAALEVSTKFLGQQVKSLKGEYNLPGTRGYTEKSLAA